MDAPYISSELIVLGLRPSRGDWEGGIKTGTTDSRPL